jgi:hypothetical protein
MALFAHIWLKTSPLHQSEPWCLQPWNTKTLGLHLERKHAVSVYIDMENWLQTTFQEYVWRAELYVFNS